MQGLSKSKGLFLFQAHNSWIYNCRTTFKTTIAYDAKPKPAFVSLKNRDHEKGLSTSPGQPGIRSVYN
jgi:hypothetical protein